MLRAGLKRIVLVTAGLVIAAVPLGVGLGYLHDGAVDPTDATLLVGILGVAVLALPLLAILAELVARARPDLLVVRWVLGELDLDETPAEIATTPTGDPRAPGAAVSWLDKLALFSIGLLLVGITVIVELAA